MKHNPKEVVNIIHLVEEFIKTLNKSCEEAGIKKVYEITIRDSKYTDVSKGIPTDKKAKQIRMHLIMLDTHERVLLYDNYYVFNNPADVLKSDYKRILYRELLYNAVGLMALNLETHIRMREDVKKEKDTINTLVDKPMTETEAIDPNKFGI